MEEGGSSGHTPEAQRRCPQQGRHSDPKAPHPGHLLQPHAASLQLPPASPRQGVDVLVSLRLSNPTTAPPDFPAFLHLSFWGSLITLGLFSLMPVEGNSIVITWV